MEGYTRSQMDDIVSAIAARRDERQREADASLQWQIENFNATDWWIVFLTLCVVAWLIFSFITYEGPAVFLANKENEREYEKDEED
jgi:hypothetical protein